LLLATPSLATLPSLNKDLRWDPTRDFRGISMFGMVPNVFVVSAQSPVTTMRDLVSLAAKSKEAVSYGSPGIGSTNHLAGELLAQEANVKLVHVPYKGQSEAVTDLLGNRLSMMPLTSAIALPYIQSGRLRPLAVSTGKRITALPDVPTVAEALYLPGYDVSSWFGLAAPKQTPDAVVRKLNSDLASVLAQPDVKEGLAKLGMERLVLSPAAFDAFIRQQTVSFGRVIKQAGIEAR
jgi:tripartite-type tricarboxylate transporter receptor subunit TctC